MLKQQVQQQKKQQQKAASLAGRRLEFPVAPGEEWSGFRNSTSKTVMLKGTVRPDQRSISWRAAIQFRVGPAIGEFKIFPGNFLKALWNVPEALLIPGLWFFL